MPLGKLTNFGASTSIYEDLVNAFPDHNKKDLKKIANKINNANTRNKVDEALDYANEILGGYGVEPIRGIWHNSFYGDIVALYANMGDTYDNTILYNTVDGEWFVGSWGDFVEKKQDEFKIK